MSEILFDSDHEHVCFGCEGVIGGEEPKVVLGLDWELYVMHRGCYERLEGELG